jgi:hypothetical protein
MPKSRSDYSVAMDVKQTGRGCFERIHLAHDGGN